MLVFALASSCAPPEICKPEQSRFAFFSKGDCVFAESSFFQGHEWITYLANQDLPEETRFSDQDLQFIAEGNRRVDWPKELLIHMNNGPIAYMNALAEHTNRPEVQKLHFLLTDKNDSREATNDSLLEIGRLTDEAVEVMNRDRQRGLTLIGRANHIIQDSFSRAHTVRDEDDGWCLQSVKAYIERARGYDFEGIQFHGTSDEEVGHITVQDSIYREGRDCHSPEGVREVEECLNEPAQRARLATSDYLDLVLRGRAIYSVRDDASDELQQLLNERVEAFVNRHFRFCE